MTNDKSKCRALVSSVLFQIAAFLFFGLWLISLVPSQTAGTKESCHSSTPERDLRFATAEITPPETG